MPDPSRGPLVPLPDTPIRYPPVERPGPEPEEAPETVPLPERAPGVPEPEPAVPSLP